jgi:uroporphyrinogen-III decarboxylase
MEKMTSRERVLAAIRREDVDYVPCSAFFNPLTPQQRVGHRWQFPWGPSDTERVEYSLLELGTDPVVGVPIGADPIVGDPFGELHPYYPNPDVTSKTWMEDDVIHKVWSTPSGELHAAIKYDISWPHGLDVPFFSDFNVGHYIEPWLKTPADLECLRHILLPARTREHLDALRLAYTEAKAIADKYQLPTFTSIGFGLTGAMLICGAEEICIMTIDQPELVDEYLELEHQLNIRHMEIAVEMGVDIIRRDGFYETADFYSPAMLDHFLTKRLQKEAEVVHQGGKLITYTANTGVMLILDHLAGLDVDCIMQIDIAFKGVDLKEIRERLGPSKSFWLGPSSAFHMWSKDPEVVRQAVRDVFDVFGKKGLVLTACPTAHSIMPWENTLAMIDEWKKIR